MSSYYYTCVLMSLYVHCPHPVTNIIDCKTRRVTRFLNRFLLHVINSLLLTEKRDSLLGICRLRLGFPHVYDNDDCIHSRHPYSQWYGTGKCRWWTVDEEGNISVATPASHQRLSFFKSKGFSPRASYSLKSPLSSSDTSWKSQTHNSPGYLPLDAVLAPCRAVPTNLCLNSQPLTKLTYLCVIQYVSITTQVQNPVK